MILRRTGLLLVVLLVGGGCGGGDNTDQASPSEAGHESSTTNEIQADSRDSSVAPARQPTTICDVAAAILTEGRVIGWLNVLPGEYVRGTECNDYDPTEHAGLLSEFHLAVEHPENPAADPGTTAGISLQLFNHVIGSEVVSEQEGSPGDPPWFSRERKAVMFDAVAFDFIDSAGRHLPAVGRDGWVHVYVGDFTLEFGYLSEHPDFERPVEPIVTNGQVSPSYHDVVSELVNATFFE